MKLLPQPGKKFYSLVKKFTGIKPKNISFYHLAFQHKSLMCKDNNGQPLNNERLEFLGDAVLGSIVAHELFKKFPHLDEGSLTKMRSRIVNRNNMNRVALKMGLERLIRTQPLNDLSQTHIPGDALEALIGAIYLDLGHDKARDFIYRNIMTEQTDFTEIVDHDTNYKSMLIEWGQKNKCSIHFVTEEFPDQLTDGNLFFAQAEANHQVMGEGTGASKKEAQQNAAFHALKNVSKFQGISFN
jgi:ribonuclease III